ncbi:cell separation during budding, partial [Tulasnella sp. 427]
SPGLTTGNGIPLLSPHLGASGSGSLGLPLPPAFGNGSESEEWMKELPFKATDLVDDATFVEIEGGQTVEAACQLMLDRNVGCLAVYEVDSAGKKNYTGLFDYADLNAFLLVAVQSHAMPASFDPDRVRKIIAKGKEGGDASVGLACDLSQKNPLVALPPTAGLIPLLTVFARGRHRVLLVDDETDTVHGLVEDRQLVRWFMEHASEHAPLITALSSPLSELTFIPSIALPRPVVSCSSDDTILDAMDTMSNEGVSSVAVMDVLTGNLLSAISVTDIGKIVAPSQDKKIIYTSLSQLVTLIKEPLGSTDGEEKYPIFSVLPSNTLDYTMQKLLVTNTHRVFITEDVSMAPMPATSLSGNLRGVVSMVDVLSVFARLANIPDVDPLSMSRHRRANSTASSSSSTSSRSRPNSTLMHPVPVPLPMGSPRRGPIDIGFGHARRGSTGFGGSLGGEGLGLSAMMTKPRSPSISRVDGASPARRPN